MSYKVRTEIFEGPFDLLVYLIESAQMSIYDIKIAEITDQYMAYMDEMQALKVEPAGEFLVLASTLLDMKSKLLLPRVVTTDDGVLIEEDPRNELVLRILEYKKFRYATNIFEEFETQMQNVFEKPQEDISEYTNEPDEYLMLGAEAFVQAFARFIEKKRKIEAVRRNYIIAERRRQNMENKSNAILESFAGSGRELISFDELVEAGNLHEDLPEHMDEIKIRQMDTVLTFTTLLEMAKQKLVDVYQKSLFGRIDVKLQGKDEGR